MRSKHERCEFIMQKLDDLYPETPIPLEHKDSYTLLIAVLLSAQCTDKRVNQITPTLFAKADSPHKMIELTVDEIAAIIRPCGLVDRKARAIRELSRILIEKHNSPSAQGLDRSGSIAGSGA